MGIELTNEFKGKLDEFFILFSQIKNRKFRTLLKAIRSLSRVIDNVEESDSAGKFYESTFSKYDCLYDFFEFMISIEHDKSFRVFEYNETTIQKILDQKNAPSFNDSELTLINSKILEAIKWHKA